jgi:ApeA N-terminal domain 1
VAKFFHLQSKFETYGEFWAPDDRSMTITGRLAREARALQFTSSPIREPIASNPERLLGGPESFDLLHGYTTEGPYTLFGVQSGSPNGTFDLRTGPAISFRRYRVSSCIFGLLLPRFDALKKGSTKFSYSGLSEWVAVHHDISREDGDVLLVRQRKSLPIFDLSSRAIRSRIKLEIIPYFQRRPNGEYNLDTNRVSALSPRSRNRLTGMYRYLPDSKTFFHS